MTFSSRQVFYGRFLFHYFSRTARRAIFLGSFSKYDFSWGSLPDLFVVDFFEVLLPFFFQISFFLKAFSPGIYSGSCRAFFRISVFARIFF